MRGYDLWWELSVWRVLRTSYKTSYLRPSEETESKTTQNLWSRTYHEPSLLIVQPNSGEIYILFKIPDFSIKLQVSGFAFLISCTLLVLKFTFWGFLIFSWVWFRGFYVWICLAFSCFAPDWEYFIKALVLDLAFTTIFAHWANL